jgi:hypothetical protein
MTVKLAPEWGGSAVAGLVADALAASQLMAARRHAQQIDLGDLAAGLLSLPDHALGHVLQALCVDRERLLSVLSGPRGTGATHSPPVAGPGLLAVIARAPHWGGDSDDATVGVRLLGEVAGTSAARTQPLRDWRIDPDRLRWAAARCGIAYTAPDVPSEPLHPPATPTLTELRVSRPDRRSAATSSVLRQLLPQNDSTGTPYGLLRARRWGIAQIVSLCLRPLTIIVMIAFGVRTESWWCVSSVLLLMSPEAVPLTASIVSRIALTVITCLEFPWPFLVLVIVSAAADGTSFWYQWWMKRVDAGNPALPPSAIRRGAARQTDHLVAAWRLERANGR